MTETDGTLELLLENGTKFSTANYNRNSEFRIRNSGHRKFRSEADCSGIHFPSEFIGIPETGIGKRKLLPLGPVTGNRNVQLSKYQVRILMNDGTRLLPWKTVW